MHHPCRLVAAPAAVSPLTPGKGCPEAGPRPCGKVWREESTGGHGTLAQTPGPREHGSLHPGVNGQKSPGCRRAKSSQEGGC